MYAVFIVFLGLSGRTDFAFGFLSSRSLRRLCIAILPLFTLPAVFPGKEYCAEFHASFSTAGFFRRFSWLTCGGSTTLTTGLSVASDDA